MITPDMVQAFFEAGSSLVIARSVWQLHKDKLVRGVSPWTVCFFMVWGWWNVFWYRHVNAPLAWWCAWLVVVTNTTWAAQMIYWKWREKRPPSGLLRFAEFR